MWRKPILIWKEDRLTRLFWGYVKRPEWEVHNIGEKTKTIQKWVMETIRRTQNCKIGDYTFVRVEVSTCGKRSE